MKKIFLAPVWIFFGLCFSCSEDIPECPSGLCLTAGQWQLVELYLDGKKFDYSTDLNDYQLILDMPPQSDATTSAFRRSFPGGSSEQGSWSVENQNTILRLVPYGDQTRTENWIIAELTPRRLVLELNRDTSIKDGPRSIRMVLDLLIV